MDGSTSAREYARRQGVSPCTVVYWVKTGKIEGVMDGGKWQIHEDTIPPIKQKDRKNRPTAAGTLQCVNCHRRIQLKGFSPSGLERGRCRECATHMERKRRAPRSPEVISYELDIAIWAEQRRACKLQNAARRERIKKHTERIASLGLAGDGEKWSNE